jgi:hypothetical protein
MNKKEIAKLLIKHPEIKALYESRAFDAPTINKIIAEEIMKEADDGDYLDEVSDVLEEYEELKEQIEVNTSFIKELESYNYEDLDKHDKLDLRDAKQDLENAQATLEDQKERFRKAFEKGSSIEGSLDASSERLEKIKDIVEKSRKALEELNRQSAEQPTDQPEQELEKVKQASNVAAVAVQAAEPEIEDAVNASREEGDAANVAKDGEETEETPEGTQKAVEAIKYEVPENVKNIKPADVEAAEEKLKPEIEASKEMQANAQDLKKKAEKVKMANEKDKVVKKAQESWNKWKNQVFKQTKGENEQPVLSNIENAESLFKQELDRRLDIYLNSDEWDDLIELGHEVPVEGTTETLRQWQETNREGLEKYFGNIKSRMRNVQGLGAQKASKEIQDIVDGLSNDALEIQNSIDNDANKDTGNGIEASGADVEGITRAEEIKKAIKEINPEAEDFPTLLGNDKFVELLFEKLKEATPEKPSNAAGDESSSDDSDDTPNQSATNLGSDKAGQEPDPNKTDSQSALGESLSGIYLAEDEEGTNTSDEQDNNPPEGSEEGGSAMSVEDATKLRDEIQKMQDIFTRSKNDNVKTINVMELAKQAFGEIPETSDAPTGIKDAEQLKEEALKSASADSKLEQSTHQDKYKKYIPVMNNFFEAPGRTKLGFMEQFLLKDQSILLWELIAQLSEIAEIGEKRAFNRAPEQDQAGVGPDAEQVGNLQEGLMDPFFERKKEPIALSKEDQVSLKTDIISLLKAIKQMKVYVSNYEKNMTRVSVDPALDGSSLEKKIQEYAAPLQQSIAKVVERAYVAHQNQTKTKYMNQEPSGDGEAPQQDPQPQGTPQVKKEARELSEALEGIMLEDEGRQASINTVEQIYNIMRKIYMPEKEPSKSTGLQGMLAKGERSGAMKEAQKMLDTAKKEEFIKLFPGGNFNDKGMPVTVGEASSALSDQIKKLIPIVKDTVMLAQGETIPHGQLLKIFTNLTTVSRTIENYFGVKSLIKEDYQAEIQKFMAEEDEANKAITENPVEPGNESSILGQAKELAGKGLEKLKQMFGWLGEETLKLLANLIDAPDLARDPMFIKFVEPFGELVVKQGGDLTARSEGSPEVKQIEKLMVETLESKSWFDSLSSEQQSAVTELIDAIYEKRNLLQELDMSSMGTVPSEVGDQISADYRMAMVLVLKDMDEGRQNLLTSLMLENEDEFVSYLVNQHELRRKMGKEKTKAIGELTLKTSDGSVQALPSAEAEIDDDEQVGKSEQQMNDLIKVLKGKGDSNVEMVLKEIKRLFPEEEDRALSVLIYYVFHRTSNLNEIVGPGQTKKRAEQSKLSEFIDMMKRAQFLTEEFRKFISQNNSNIRKLLTSNPVKTILEDTDGFFMKTLGNLLSKKADLKRDVQKMKSNTQGKDKPSDSEENPEVEMDDEAGESDALPPKDVENEDGDAESESYDEKITPEKVQKAEEIIQKYKAKMGIPEEAKGILKPLLPPKSMEKLGKDSIEVLAAIIKIAEIYINDAKGKLGDPEPMEESVSKIFNKIKKSANTFMNNRKVKKEFSDWKGAFESYLPDGKLKDAKEYLIFLLKFIKGDNLASILLQLSYYHGNIDLAVEAVQYLNNSNKTETDNVDDEPERTQNFDYYPGNSDRLGEALKPIIEKMLKEHYNY